MRALIKNSKKIVLNQVDPSERALIDDFVRKSLKQATSIRSLYDIDNELDGVSFELTGKKPGTITFRTPCIQVVAVNGNIKVDLKLDSETNIIVDSDENGDYLGDILVGETDIGYCDSDAVTEYLSTLSTDAKKVLKLLVEGYNKREIREKLGYSESRVSDLIRFMKAPRRVKILRR